MSADFTLTRNETASGRATELRARTARFVVPVRCEFALTRLMQAYQSS